MTQPNPRYEKHYLLRGLGEEGQQKLAKATVLVIGAGGLGCPALHYLAAAGVGTIGIIDFDTVTLGNLQRQVLYDTSDVGKSKAMLAAQRLKDLNPGISVNYYNVAITNSNAFGLLKDYDIIVDCTDNFSSRYLINDACVVLSKPLVFAAVFQFEGQVAVFNVTDETGLSTNYRHLFAIPPDPLEVQSCNETGVLGTLTGIIGTMQATEVIKLITGLAGSLKNKLLSFNLLSYESFVVDLTANETVRSLIPKDQAAFEAMDYKWLCGETVPGVNALEIPEFLNAIKQSDHLVIDVRELNELPKLDLKNRRIPLSLLMDQVEDLGAGHIILVCQSGKRSLKAAELLYNAFGASKKISHLSGGITKLLEHGYE